MLGLLLLFLSINSYSSPFQRWRALNGKECSCELMEMKIGVKSETEVATAMMTSPVWTRATIVREPKERILSAFLDKAVKEHSGNSEKGGYYIKKCCERIPDESDKQRCKERDQEFKSFLFFITKYQKECFDVHWEAQVAKIDSKWWPYIDFVGHQENLVNDAKALLSGLTSTMFPSQNAWERYGTRGWGNDNDLCEKRPNAFLEENSSSHKLDTGSHLMEWYTPKTEKMVEGYLSAEWEQKKANFRHVTLFPTDQT